MAKALVTPEERSDKNDANQPIDDGVATDEAVKVEEVCRHAQGIILSFYFTPVFGEYFRKF